MRAGRAPLRLWLWGLLALSALPGAAAGKGKGGKKGGKGARRTGDEGQSGQRCTICQALALEARKVWKLARTTKSGSPYYYIGTEVKEPSAEERVIESVKKKVCNKPFLNTLPNPNGYTLHLPTVHFDCEDLLESHGSGLFDALTLGEDLAVYCWEAEICGDGDEKSFDLDEEDDDDRHPDL
mmetsp:Transcript_112628/g.351131  ORF Transcript_112628/g.351131 Transcript_112628/m.351131 type:complete len:182 (+) Transcript_112628:47-592(+)